MDFTSDQLSQLVEAYAERMVNNMDIKTMEQFVYDTIVENLGIQSPDDIMEALSDHYSQDELDELIEVVKS